MQILSDNFDCSTTVSSTIIKTKRYDNFDAIDPIFNRLLERHCNQQLVFENGIHFRAFLQEKKAFLYLKEILEANLRKALQCCCNGCYQQLPVGCVSSQSIISPGMSSCTFFHEKPFKKLWNEIKIGRAAQTFSFA